VAGRLRCLSWRSAERKGWGEEVGNGRSPPRTTCRPWSSPAPATGSPSRLLDAAAYLISRTSIDEEASSVSLAVDPVVFPNLKRHAQDDHHHDQATEEEPGAHSSVHTRRAAAMARRTRGWGFGSGGRFQACRLSRACSCSRATLLLTSRWGLCICVPFPSCTRGLEPYRLQRAFLKRNARPRPYVSRDLAVCDMTHTGLIGAGGAPERHAGERTAGR
jgi:hypothetical protein